MLSANFRSTHFRRPRCSTKSITPGTNRLAETRNQAAGVIPCHRAVGASGGLTGYRWGVARKERLLAAERLAEGRRRSNT